MELKKEVKACIEKSVLCWLATSSLKNVPNVSPKEIFTFYGNTAIIVANIASPQTVQNIKKNEHVCISFIDILVQKGFQIEGNAEIINGSHAEFPAMEKLLIRMTDGKFPFSTITKITIKQVKPIIAPKYLLYPETTEKEQIESAKKVYGF